MSNPGKRNVMDEIEASMLVMAPCVVQRTKLPEDTDHLPSQRGKPALQACVPQSFEPKGHEDVEAEICGQPARSEFSLDVRLELSLRKYDHLVPQASRFQGHVPTDARL
jgi:hypothetical protein